MFVCIIYTPCPYKPSAPDIGANSARVIRRNCEQVIGQSEIFIKSSQVSLFDASPSDQPAYPTNARISFEPLPARVIGGRKTLERIGDRSIRPALPDPVFAGAASPRRRNVHAAGRPAAEAGIPMDLGIRDPHRADRDRLSIGGNRQRAR